MSHGAEICEDSPASEAIGASAATDAVADQRGQRSGSIENTAGEADDNDETAQQTRHHSTSPVPAPAPDPTGSAQPRRRLRHDTLASHDGNTLGDDNDKIREEANTFIARGPPLEPFYTPFDEGGGPFRSHPPPKPTGEEPEGSHTQKAAAGSAGSDDDSDIQEPPADDADQGDSAPADPPKQTQQDADDIQGQHLPQDDNEDEAGTPPPPPDNQP